MTASLPVKKICKVVLFLATILSGGTISIGQNTYYSYKNIHLHNGDWHHERTWTLSVDGDDITEPSVSPQNGDNLIITENTVVKLFDHVLTSNLSIEIRQGGTLVLHSHQFINNLASLTGKGTLIIENNYYPSVTSNHSFGGVGGGHTIYRLDKSGNLKFPATLTQANHLSIEAINSANFTMGVGHNLQVNGNFHLKSASYSASFNFILGEDATTNLLDIKGNLSIDERVHLGIAQNNRVHNIRLAGNLHVDGTIKLSNSNQYSTANNGAAVFTFTGNNDNTVTGSGSQLDFYRLIVDKGIDQTYVLDFQHTALKLFGPVNQSNGGSDPNPTINKALWIKNGTLRLREGIIIPQLSSGGNDFFIPLNGALWIDGAEVHSTTTSGGSSDTGITLIGTLRISGGKLLTNKAAGIVYRGTGLLLLEGGELNINQFRPSTATGTHQASWVQTGGTANITGDGENSDLHPRFSLPLPSHSFTMTGGELNIYKPNSNNRGFVVGASQGNIQVSGGTVNLFVPNNRDFGVSITAPIFELNIYKEGSTNRNLNISDINHSFGTNYAQSLTVLTNLTLFENARLSANGNDVSIGGHFTIKQGADYITGENTTLFFYSEEEYGIRDPNITIDKDYRLNFHHVIFRKIRTSENTGGQVRFVSQGREPGSFIGVVNGHLEHYGRRSSIQFNGFNIELKGDVTIERRPRRNEGPWWYNTVIHLRGDEWQNIKMYSLSRDNNNPFSRYVIDNLTGVILKEEFEAEYLDLKNGIFNLGNFQATLHHPVIGTGFDKNRQVQTNGNAGDLGLRYRYRETGAGTFLYPVGVAGKYTPFELIITGSGQFSRDNNYLSVSPVNERHPGVAPGNENQALRYYWKTLAELSGSYENLSFQYKFTHHPDDAGTENNSIPNRTARLTTGEWDINNNYNNPMYFSGFGFSTSDFTAGRQNTFANGQLPGTFFSTKSGNWNDSSVWLEDGEDTNKIPGDGSTVIIASSHTITITANATKANTVLISNNGVLDLNTSQGHVFENIRGEGLLRLASPNLPRNRFNKYDNLTNFIENDKGTIEYYGTEMDYTLSNEILTYHNLRFSEKAIKTLPAGDLQINGNLRLEGSTNTNNQPTSETNVRTNPNASGTISIHGQLLMDGTGGNYNNGKKSTLIFSEGGSWTLVAYGYVRSQNRGSIIVQQNATSPTSHSLYLMSGIEGRGNLDLYGDGTVTVDLIFRGGGINTISGLHSSNSWKVNRIVVDKNESDDIVSIRQPFTLEGNSQGTPKALELKQGTFVMTQTSNDITLTSGGANFHIPTTATLIVEGDNIVRTSGNSNIELNGSLILNNNAQAIFEGTATDIIYGTSGQSVLELHNNAQMEVSGQIRRTTENPGAMLQYRQTGTSKAIIGTGNPSVSNRATFEVLNNGSEFILENTATLTIANASSAGFPALYLEPQTGFCQGNIFMGNANTRPNQQMGIRSTLPLNSLLVSTSNAPVAYLHTRDLMLQGNLSIRNDAVFQSRGYNMEIKGDIVNDGVFEAQNKETVLLSGGTHSISGMGNTTFHNLKIDAISGLTTEMDITTTGNFHLVRGFVNDKGYWITIGGNLTNNGTHTSPLPYGGMLLNGENTQEVRGQGNYGRLTLDKANQSQAVAYGSITIHNQLMLLNGILNMSQHRLTLMEDAVLTTGLPGVPFSNSRMVRLGGNMGDAGIRKYFSVNDIQMGEFTFPIGTDDLYTGAHIFDLNQFTPGRMITMYAVKQHHPTITNGSNGSDPDRVLQYYWGVESDMGSSDLFAGKLHFHFHSSHVAGNINEYFTAQLRPAEDDSWSKLDTGVNTHTLEFNHNSVTGNIFNGFYTAGEDDAIPANVPRFVAINDGPWENPAVWPAGGDLPPSGVIVEIPFGKTVTITENLKRVYKTVINGHLIVEPQTTYHNLGIVEGQGTLELKGTGDQYPVNLPTGRYESFMACGNNSTVKFSGLGGLLPANRASYNNLILAGSGYKAMPLASEINICGLLSIEDNVTMIARDNQVYYISGHFALGQNANLIADTPRAHFIMNGNQPQQIIGNFTSNTHNEISNALYRVRIQNPQSVVILGEGLEITNLLYIDNGLLVSRNSHLTLSNPVHDALANYSRSNFIDGPLTRALPSSSSQKFVFPVSQNNKPHFVSVEPSGSTQGLWTAEFFNASPGENGMNPAAILEPVKKVSQTEYWSVEGPEGGRAYVSLHWGPTSGISLDDNDLNTMLIAEWENNHWAGRGMTDYYAEGSGHGFIRSHVVTFSKKYFTLGSSDAENPLPIELLSFNARVEKNKVELQWVTAAEINNDFFTIERSRNGKDFEVVAIVGSKAKNGFSNTLLTYGSEDNSPLSGVTYYRLKQTDFDGSYEYSDPVSVNFVADDSQVSFNLFPNPNSGVSFRMVLNGLPANETMEVVVADLSGRSVYSTRIYSDYNGNLGAFIVPNGRLSKGVYMVMVAGKSGSHTMKLLVQ